MGKSHYMERINAELNKKAMSVSPRQSTLEVEK